MHEGAPESLTRHVVRLMPDAYQTSVPHEVYGNGSDKKKCLTILLLSHRVAHYEHCFNDMFADQPGCSKHSMLARLKGEGTQSYTKHWFH